MDASGATSHHSSRRSSRHSHHEGRLGRKSKSHTHSDTQSTSSSARSAPRRTSLMTALERAGGRPGSESHGRSTTKRPAAALAVGIPATAAAADDQQKMRRIRIALVVLRMLVVGNLVASAAVGAYLTNAASRCMCGHPACLSHDSGHKPADIAHQEHCSCSMHVWWHMMIH